MTGERGAPAQVGEGRVVEVPKDADWAGLLRVVEKDTVEGRDSVDHAVREVKQALRAGRRAVVARAGEGDVDRLCAELNARAVFVALGPERAELPQDGAEADGNARRLVPGEVRDRRPGDVRA